MLIFALAIAFLPFQGRGASAAQQDETLNQAPVYTQFIPYIANTTISTLYIPAGEFIMGSNSDGHPETSPEHIVYLDGYEIFRTMVTNR